MTNEEAIKELKECLASINTVRNAIKALQERKTGKWVLIEMGDTNLYECSLCRNRKTYTSPFCEMCGAELEVDHAMDS